MKIHIESTSKVVDIDGVPARIWEGHTESGIPIHCYITRVAVDRNADASEFERELTETRAPSPAVQVIPTRLVL